MRLVGRSQILGMSQGPFELPTPALPWTPALQRWTSALRSQKLEHRIPAVTGMWRSFLEVEERTVQVTGTLDS